MRLLDVRISHLALSITSFDEYIARAALNWAAFAFPQTISLYSVKHLGLVSALDFDFPLGLFLFSSLCFFKDLLLSLLFSFKLWPKETQKITTYVM